MNQMRPDTTKAFDLTVDHFLMVSDWYHLALLECLSIPTLPWEPKVLAKFLGLKVIQIEAAIERLYRLELIEEVQGSKKPRRSINRLLVQASTPSEAIYKYFDQILEKARLAIQSQTPNERVLGSEIFAFDPEKIDEVRQATHRYLEQLQEIARKSSKRTELYQAQASVFRINQPQKSRKEPTL
jgi:DNA-binding MarR family transcriptional regulator